MIEGETTFETATTEYVKITRKLKEARDEFNEEFEEVLRREKETAEWYEEVIRRHLELPEDSIVDASVSNEIRIGLIAKYSRGKPLRIFDNDLFQKLKQLPSEFEVYFNFYEGMMTFPRFEICLKIEDDGGDDLNE